MIAIAIDDEQLMLYALVKAIKASNDIEDVVGFSNCDEALDWIEINTPDVAFLDINLRGINGIGMAEKITALHPDCKIVFCTGYEEYAVSAFKIHASGYLLKPISAEDVQKEIDVIKGRKIEKGVLKASDSVAELTYVTAGGENVYQCGLFLDSCRDMITHQEGW